MQSYKKGAWVARGPVMALGIWVGEKGEVSEDHEEGGQW